MKMYEPLFSVTLVCNALFGSDEIDEKFPSFILLPITFLFLTFGVCFYLLSRFSKL